VTLAPSHLIVAPVVLPLVTATILVLLGDANRRAKGVVNIGAALVGVLIALALLSRVDGPGAGVYLASNWEAPYGIVLVADALSTLMLALASVVALCVAVYSEARWARTGTYFHALFQVQLMGLNGAFLTGDLFNLFVFFELMLAASYGLQLHGSGWPRVRSGLHYIAVNLLASSLFLIGLAIIYGITGTLSMADIARRLPLVAAGDRGLLHAGMAVLAVAFLIKAAIWPLNAWLVPTYAAASAPVAALFALMTKVGLYVIVRLWTLFFSDPGPSSHFGAPVLVVAGLMTLSFGTLGLISSMQLRRVAGYSIIVSSGTLLFAVGIGKASVTAAALFYLLTATCSVSALFLLVELMERIGGDTRPQRRADREVDEDTNLDDDETPLVGRAFPLSLALLGIGFMTCSVLVAGLPPLSGFIAKLALLRSVLGFDTDAASAGPVPAVWWFLGLLLTSGLAATITLARSGIRHFWRKDGASAPQVKVLEAVSVCTLILCGVGLTVNAERVLHYTNAAAAGLHSPAGYIDAVFATLPRPGPTRPDLEPAP
jgi:multicomponent K+:H+ antiporter subunit D